MITSAELALAEHARLAGVADDVLRQQDRELRAHLIRVGAIVPAELRTGFEVAGGCIVAHPARSAGSFPSPAALPRRATD